MNVFEDLIDSKILKILRLLAANKNKQFHIKKISVDSEVPLTSTFRIVRKLVALDLINQIKIDKLKIYKFADNEKTKEFENSLLGRKNDQ